MMDRLLVQPQISVSLLMQYRIRLLLRIRVDWFTYMTRQKEYTFLIITAHFKNNFS